MPKIVASLSELNCEIRCCEKTIDFDGRSVPATEEDWSTEYLAPIVSLKSVLNVDEAINHIAQYGTGHTESIISENKDNQNKNDQNKDDNKSDKPKENKNQQSKLSPQQIKNLLKAMENAEKKVQAKVNDKKQKGTKVVSEKDW